MMRASIHQVASWLNQLSTQPDITIQGVSTDTRTLAPGNLFVALKGERFDGHDHLAAAVAAGAVAAVVSHSNPDINLPQIVVEDTLIALQTLGQCWRDQVDPFVIAITGSAGKTTVKQLLASICAQVGATRATVGNLNNDIGVPLTLLSLDSTDRFAVIEMGANHVGEIARLTTLARPDVALVTMAGRAHVGEFGSIDAIVQAKGELYAGLTPDAKAVINLDSYGADRWWTHCPAHRFGFSLASDVRARWAGEYRTATNRLAVSEDGQPLLSDLALPLPGAHNATNLLAAISVARAAGLSLEAITNGLREFTPPPGRMSLVRCTERLTVINDTYNANPESMRAALDYLVSLPGRHVAVLGDMGELGDQSDELHEALIRYAQTLSLDGLFTLGDAMSKAMAAASSEAPTATQVLAADAPETIAEKLISLLNSTQPDSSEGAPVAVLLKGSRFMRMERMMNWLVPAHQTSEAH
jgi:UDP-N-acetylmuramoyl-tripeptide--D-alanyl-D-alanine ligase